jgi:hypothetical protein
MSEVGRVRTGNWSQFITLSGEETFPLGHSHWGTLGYVTGTYLAEH